MISKHIISVIDNEAAIMSLTSSWLLTGSVSTQRDAASR